MVDSIHSLGRSCGAPSGGTISLMWFAYLDELWKGPGYTLGQSNIAMENLIFPGKYLYQWIFHCQKLTCRCCDMFAPARILEIFPFNFQHEPQTLQKNYACCCIWYDAFVNGTGTGTLLLNVQLIYGHKQALSIPPKHGWNTMSDLFEEGNQHKLIIPQDPQSAMPCTCGQLCKL